MENISFFNFYLEIDQIIAIFAPAIMPDMGLLKLKKKKGQMAFSLPRMSHNLVERVFNQPIARQFCQHYREPYNLQQAFPKVSESETEYKLM